MLAKTRPKPKPLELFPHQKEYINWAKDKQHIPCIMEMRLGKNISNIRLIKEHWCLDPFELYPILVLCPGNVIEAWEEELKREREDFLIVSGNLNKRVESVVDFAFNPHSTSTYPMGRKWVLLNFEGLTFTPGIAGLPWFIALIDESTRIKNPKTKISKICTTGFKEVQHRGILSGLPSPEGELDLFQQYYYVFRSFMGCDNYYKYRNKYFRMSWRGWIPKAGYKSAIQEEVHRLSFVRTKAEEGLQSEKVRMVRTVEMKPSQRKIYDDIEKDFAAEVEINGKLQRVETNHTITQHLWLARTSTGCNLDGTFNPEWDAKCKEFIHLCKTEFVGKPVVGWFRFTSEILYYMKELRKAGINVETLTGADNSLTKKKAKQNWFRKQTGGRVILCQELKVAEYGVDMSCASIAIYVSCVYSGQTISQTEERTANITKKEPLLYVYLVTKDTIDEDIVEVIREKVSDAKMFLQKVNMRFINRINRKYNINRGIKSKSTKPFSRV